MLVLNCILWNNNNDQIDVNGQVLFSNIQGGYEGEGNIDADPLFCDADNGDFTLASDSPVLGIGQDGADMGAFGVGCAPIIYGCTDQNADNYNPNANQDDGSCQCSEGYSSINNVCIYQQNNHL